MSLLSLKKKFLHNISWWAVLAFFDLLRRNEIVADYNFCDEFFTANLFSLQMMVIIIYDVMKFPSQIWNCFVATKSKKNFNIVTCHNKVLRQYLVFCDEFFYSKFVFIANDSYLRYNEILATKSKKKKSLQKPWQVATILTIIGLLQLIFRCKL